MTGKHVTTVLATIFGFAVGSLAIATPGQEFILNGNFAQNFTSWNNSDGDGSGTAILFKITSGEAQVHSRSSSCTASYCAQLRQVGNASNPTLLGLQPGKVYTLSFSAHAGTNGNGRPVDVSISTRDAETINNNYYKIWERLFTLTTTPTPYSFRFRTPEDLWTFPNAGPREIWVSLEVPNAAVDAYFDNVSLVETPPLTYADSTLVLSSFETGSSDSWFGGTRVASPAGGPPGTGATSLELRTGGANGRAFAHTLVPMNLADPAVPADPYPGWDMVLRLWVDQPANVGRMYVALRSSVHMFNYSDRDPKYQYLLRPFGGFNAGWNDVILPREDFDAFRYWHSRDAQWNDLFDLFVKLESNANGEARVLIDKISLQPVTTAAEPYERRAPIISKVAVLSTNAADPTIRFEMDGTPPIATVECGQNAGTYNVTLNDCASSTQFGSCSSGPIVTETCSLATGQPAFLPAKPLHCRVRATDAQGRTSQTGDFTFTTAPSTPPVPGPDTAYQVGIYSAAEPSDLVLSVQSGFTTGHSYFMDACDPPPAGYADWQTAATAYLDAAASVGAHVLLNSFCARDTLDPATLTQMESHVWDRVTGVCRHEGLGGYYLSDEPEIHGVDPVREAQIYDYIRSIEEEGPPPPSFAPVPCPTRHDVIIGSCSIGGSCPGPQGGAYPYLNALDVVAMDYYPIPKQAPESVWPAMQLTASAGKPFTFTFQSFQAELDVNWPVTNLEVDNSTRYPSKTEMRVMAWLGIVGGAREIWTYSFPDIMGFRSLYSSIDPPPCPYVGFPGSEWHWAQLTDVVREIRSMGPVIASGPSSIPISGPATTHAIKYTTRSYGGKNYVIAVNSSPSASQATFTATGSLGPIRVFDGSTAPTWTYSGPNCQQGTFTASLLGYEVRVYEIPPDVDTDGDGVFDACDNCPADRNANQWDCNDNKIGDACEGPCTTVLNPLDDGYVTSAGAVNTNNSTLVIGDAKVILSAYVDILSFGTGATIQGGQVLDAKLTLVRKSVSGTPALLGSINVDTMTGYFGAGSAIAADDYSAPATGTLASKLPIPATNGSAASAPFGAGNLAWINTAAGGLTQFRLRFDTPANTNGTNDQVIWNSNEATTASLRPTLQITYTAP